MTESKKKTSSRQTKKTKATTKKTPAREAASKTTRAKPATAPKPAKPAKPTKPAAPAKPARLVATARKSEPAGKVSGTIQVKLVRSLIGRTPHQRAVVAGLGLRRLNQTVERMDTREIRGMVAKVPHLVTILG